MRNRLGCQTSSWPAKKKQTPPPITAIIHRLTTQCCLVPVVVIIDSIVMTMLSGADSPYGPIGRDPKVWSRPCSSILCSLYDKNVPGICEREGAPGAAGALCASWSLVRITCCQSMVDMRIITSSTPAFRVTYSLNLSLCTDVEYFAYVIMCIYHQPFVIVLIQYYATSSGLWGP